MIEAQQWSGCFNCYSVRDEELGPVAVPFWFFGLVWFSYLTAIFFDQNFISLYVKLVPHSTAKPGLKLTILLSEPPKSWNDRLVLPHPATLPQEPTEHKRAAF